MRQTTTLAAACLMLAALPAHAQPAVEGETGFVVGYMGSFVKSCVKQVHAAPPVPQVACACMAALTADRATKDEIVTAKGDLESLSKVHPEIKGFVPLCAAAAGAAR